MKVIAPAWSLIGIVSSAAIIGKDRQHVDRRQFLGLLPGCALGIAAGLFVFKTLDAALLAHCLGVFILLYAAYAWWMTTRPAGARPPVPPAVLRPAASVRRRFSAWFAERFLPAGFRCCSSKCRSSSRFMT